MGRYLKAVAIRDQVLATVSSITEGLKARPKTGKKGRNIFIKTYNRKPGNKRRRAAIIAVTCLKAVTGAAQIARIISTPHERK